MRTRAAHKLSIKKAKKIALTSKGEVTLVQSDKNQLILNYFKVRKVELGGSHGLVVMGGDSCSKGRGFEF